MQRILARNTYRLSTRLGIAPCTLAAALGPAAALFERSNRWMVGGAIGATAAVLASVTLLHRAAGAAVVALVSGLIASLAVSISAPAGVSAAFGLVAAVETPALPWLYPEGPPRPREPLARRRPRD